MHLGAGSLSKEYAGGDFRHVDAFQDDASMASASEALLSDLRLEELLEELLRLSPPSHSSSPFSSRSRKRTSWPRINLCFTAARSTALTGVGGSPPTASWRRWTATNKSSGKPTSASLTWMLNNEAVNKRDQRGCSVSSRSCHAGDCTAASQQHHCSCAWIHNSKLALH